MPKLTHEEIAERRRLHFENIDRGQKLIERLFGSDRANNPAEYKALFEEWRESIPIVCEHEKSMVESCLACDDIFKQCFPENCFMCVTCDNIYVNEEEVDEDGICDECRYSIHKD